MLSSVHTHTSVKGLGVSSNPVWFQRPAFFYHGKKMPLKLRALSKEYHLVVSLNGIKVRKIRTEKDIVI